MSRREFPTSVRVAIIKRSTHGAAIYCEYCTLPTKRFQIDHVRADGLLGEPTIENAMLICESCWRIKNPDDASKIAEAKRREASHLGARRPKQAIKSGASLRGPERSHEGRQSLPPRKIYEDRK